MNEHPVPRTVWPKAARDALEAIYRDVDRDIQALGVVCRQRGICCDFERNDHRLFASSIEVTYVRESHPDAFDTDSLLCPFWVDGHCVERDRRPLGCRTYFCDDRFRSRLEALYEKYHAEIKRVATRHGLPYGYAPFVDALRRPSRGEQGG